MAALSTLALLALSGAKTAGAYGDQRRAASAVQSQGDFDASQLTTNAGLADQNAADVLARGAEAEGQQRSQTRVLGGAQRAALAGSGVVVDSGSAADVVNNDQRLGELDALRIRNNARRDAWGYQVQAADYRNQAAMTRTAAANQAGSIRKQSVGTLLSGAGELADIYASAPKSVSKAPVSGSPLKNGYVRAADGFTKGKGGGSF